MKYECVTDIVFVVLHYKNYVDTVECVESITNKIDTASYFIVIVDNASNDGSCEVLRGTFISNKKISIIKNDSNLGYARGINVGIDYARDMFSPKFIAAINNDIVILSNDFFYTLQNKFNEIKFAVLGPMLITRNGQCNVNPIGNKIKNLEDIQKEIRYNKRILFFSKIHCLDAYRIIKKNLKRDRQVIKDFLLDQVDVELHGSFLVFSQKYFEHFEGLDPSTFLYCEEDILYLHLMKKGLHTLYTSDIKIYHKEDSSVDNIFPAKRKKAEFIARNSIISLKIYISIYKQYFLN